MANFCIMCFESKSFVLGTHEAVRLVELRKINDNFHSFILESSLSGTINSETSTIRFGRELLSYLEFLEVDADVSTIVYRGRIAIKIHIAGYRSIIHRKDEDLLKICFIKTDEKDTFEEEEEDTEKAPNEL